MRVLLLVIAMTSLARADDRETARTEFAAGEAADKQHDWQNALVHYLRANELVRHPFAIYNIAVDYERLGQLRESATWYQRYLELAQDSPDRDKVTQKLGELKSRPAALSVGTIPVGARVTIDAAPAGTTPLTTKLRGGVHHVAVDLDGQHDERDVELMFGEPAELAFTLQPHASTLYVTGVPIGAYVAVDNVTVGVIPATAVVAPGKHRVRVSAFGYAPYETWGIVDPGQQSNVDVVLTRGDDTTALATRPLFPFSYVLGVTAGADASTGNGLVLADFGARLAQFEGLVRVGHAGGATVVDFIVRWALLRSALSPVLGAGYMYIDSGFGYEANAGLRLDLARGDHVGLSLVGDLGIRWFSGTDAMGAVSTVDYPLEVSAEVFYR